MPQEIIDVQQLQQRLDKPLLLIDVREPGEYEAYHVPNARLFPLSQFDAERTVAALGAKDQAIYVLCQMGGRAAQACELLEASGHAHTVLVDGGTQAWANAGYALAAGMDS